MGITVYTPGDRVHRWTLIGHRPDKRAYECKCDCGQVAFITVGSLRSGTSKHCIACRRREESGNSDAVIVGRRGTIDITGQQFAKWTVLSRAADQPGGAIHWNCRCECGRTKPVNGATLRTGRSKGCSSCAGKAGPNAGRFHPGTKVGKWTVESFDSTRGNYRCRCECGKTAGVPGAKLSSGKSVACRACWIKTRKRPTLPPQVDLTGQKFGRWTVLYQDRSQKSRRSRWLCRCECGRTVSVLHGGLRSGQSTQCSSCAASAKSQSAVVDLTGKTFGKWTVLARDEQHTKGNAYWRCRCQCGREKSVNGSTLRCGRSSSCNRCAVRTPAGT